MSYWDFLEALGELPRKWWITSPNAIRTTYGECPITALYNERFSEHPLTVSLWPEAALTLGLPDSVTLPIVLAADWAAPDRRALDEYGIEADIWYYVRQDLLRVTEAQVVW